jgi:hypothetical protein
MLQQGRTRLVLGVEAAPAANAKPRWCGTLHGGKVVIVRGAVRCATARRVLGYALTYVSGNGPASPRGWECFRISRVRAYNGDECIAPPGAEAHPPKRIQVRFRRWRAGRRRRRVAFGVALMGVLARQPRRLCSPLG